MTREDILAMEAGRELDALVAEKVMGWRIETYAGVPDLQMAADWVSNTAIVCEVDEWGPSDDMSAAWEVVEKMQGKYNFFLAYNHKDKDFQAFFDVPNEDDSATIESYQYDAQTAPEAICISALLAVTAQA